MNRNAGRVLLGLDRQKLGTVRSANNGSVPWWLVAALSVTTGLMILSPMWPFLYLADWPHINEIGLHHVPMRAWVDWLASGRTLGWDHSWFNGYPLYQFYFPAPALGWMLLDLAFPSHTAYLLMTVLCVPATGWAAWWWASTWKTSRVVSGLFSACFLAAFCVAGASLGDKVDGGLFNVLFGTFSHQWAVVCGLCYLAALNNACYKQASTQWGVAAGFLMALCALSHPYIAVLVGIGSLGLLTKRTVRVFAVLGVTAAGLSAWWWVPFATGTQYAHITSYRLVGWADVLNPSHVALLPLAGAAVVVLWKQLPHPRVLTPLVVLMVVPFLLRTVPFNPFQADNGRMFFMWVVAVPALGAYLVLHVALRYFPGRWEPWFLTCVHVLLGLMATIAVWSTIGYSPKNLDIHHDAWCTTLGESIGGLPKGSNVYAPLWVPMFPSCGLAPIYSGAGLAAQAPGANLRTPFGLLRESSPTSLFYYEMLRHERSPQLDWLAPNLPLPDKRVVPVGQMMTLGADFYWGGENADSGNEWLTAVPQYGLPSMFKVADKPPTWPAEWVSPTVNHDVFIQSNLAKYRQWVTPDDVTIPILAARPDGCSTWVVPVGDGLDLTDDRYVRFESIRGECYYISVSYHPNWELTTGGEGPFPAGPNQMVVRADAGPVVLEWATSLEELAGQAITAISLAVLLILGAVTIRGTRGRSASGTLPA